MYSFRWKSTQIQPFFVKSHSTIKNLKLRRSLAQNLNGSIYYKGKYDEFQILIISELSFSANELTVQLFTIPTVSGFQTAFNYSHKASPTLVGSLILPIDELFTGEAFDHWLEITREDPVKHEDISVGEMHLHIIVVTKLFDHNRELTPRLERTGVLKGTTYKMLSASSDSLDSVIKTSVPSLNLALYTSSENSAKPTLSFVLASSRGNGPHINKDQIISQDTEAMIGGNKNQNV